MQYFKLLFTYFSLALLGLLFFDSCQEESKKDENYQFPERPDNLLYITAEITNLPPLTSVALYRLDPRTEAAKLVAERKVPDGTFSFPVTVKSPTYFMLLVDNTKQVPLLMHRSDVKVMTNYDNFNVLLSTQGCRDTDLLVKLQDLKKRMSAQRGQMSPEQFSVAREKAIEDFIEKAMPSMIAMSAVATLPLEEYEGKYREVLGELKSLYPDSPYLKNFEESIALKKQFRVGNKLADQTLPIFEGDTIQLSDLQGKYVLLDFWYARYPNIMKDNQVLSQVYETFKKDLEIVSVSLDGDARYWNQAKAAMPWKHVYDVDQEDFFSKVASTYGYFSLNVPTTFLLDREGTIVELGIRGAELGPKMTALLAEEE